MVAALGVAGLNASHLPLALIAVIFAALGFATACTLVPTRSLLQQHLAPDRMGRMTALSKAATALAILIAPSFLAQPSPATTVPAPPFWPVRACWRCSR